MGFFGSSFLRLLLRFCFGFLGTVAQKGRGVLCRACPLGEGLETSRSGSLKLVLLGELGFLPVFLGFLWFFTGFLGFSMVFLRILGFPLVLLKDVFFFTLS